MARAVRRSRLSARLLAGVVAPSLAELPGGDNLTFVGDTEVVAAEIEEFLAGSRTPPMPDRVLATILFTDIAGSTERAAEVGDRRWRELLGRHDLEVRAAVHTGEVELRGGDIGGDRGPYHLAGHGVGPAERGAGVQYREGAGRGSRDRGSRTGVSNPSGGARSVAPVRGIHLTRCSWLGTPAFGLPGLGGRPGRCGWRASGPTLAPSWPVGPPTSSPTTSETSATPG
jgi:hypothetical protein